MSRLNFIAKIDISNIRICAANFFLKFESIFGSAENNFEFFRKNYFSKISREAKSFVKFC